MYRARPTDLHPPSSRALLRLLETTDLHMHLFAHDYYTGRRAPGIGLARAARLIAGLRDEVPNALLFDNGDFLQGSPLADRIGRRLGSPPAGLHPGIGAMNRLDYAAATLGNHDFSYGLTFLDHVLQGARFPVVLANARRGDGPHGSFRPPYALIERDLVTEDGGRRPLRLGVIGLVPPQTAVWERDSLDGQLVVDDMVASAAAQVPRMRAEGAELVVALAHTGIGGARHVPGMENAAVPLAAVEGVDVLLLGHAHEVFPSPGFRGREGCEPDRGTIGGKPAVMAGSLGSHVGVIDLTLTHEAGRWTIAAARVAALPVAVRRRGRQPGSLRAAVEILTEAKADHRATQRRMSRVVGWTATTLATHFALVGDSAAMRLVARAKAEVLRDLVAGSGVEALPVVATMVPFRAGGRGGPLNFTHVPPGPVLERHLADLYPFDNRLRATVMSGADLADMLERAASVFRTVAPGAVDAPLLDPEFPAHAFETASGLTYRIDVSVPALYSAMGERIGGGPGRVRDLCHDGQPIDPDARFLVATNSYRNARDSVRTGDRGKVPMAEDLPVRDVLRRFLQRQPIRDLARPCWRLLLPPGASVLFDTAPGADPAACPLPAEPVGLTDEGFLRLRLRGPAG